MHLFHKQIIAILAIGLLLVGGCSHQSEKEQSQQIETAKSDNAREESDKEVDVMRLYVQVNGHTFSATLENNSAVSALIDQLQEGPITLSMSDYAGFEKVGPLGMELPADDTQTTTQAGDIVLYQGNQIVIFYGSNTWSYTRIGRIDDLNGWSEALGNGNVDVTFSLEK